MGEWYQSNAKMTRREEDWLESELDRLEEEGKIYKTRSKYNSGVILVPKGDQFRLCINYKKYNEHIVNIPKTIPNLLNNLQRTRGFTWFQKLDLEAAYWRLKTGKEIQSRLAFTDHKGVQYTWNVMPFGVADAPALFNSYMGNVLDGLNGVIYYFDDILIMGNTPEEVKTITQEVMKRLKENNLKINWKKSTSEPVQDLEYLGYQLNKGKLLIPDDKKDQIVKALLKVKNKKTAQKALGKLLHYRMLLPNQDVIKKDIGEIIKGNRETLSKSGKEWVVKLANITQWISNASVQEGIILRTDASDVGWAGALIEEDESVIARASGLFNPQEALFSTAEREMLAIVKTVKSLRGIIDGNGVHLQTDNQTVEKILKNDLNPESRRLQRLTMKIREALKMIKISHIKGKDMGAIDAESRKFDKQIAPENFKKWDKSLTWAQVVQKKN